MKFRSTFLTIALFTLLFFPGVSWAQTINLGTAANFVLFTSNGAIDNLGDSYFTGDLGTNVGSFTGFGTSTVNGSKYTANSITAQASVDVIAAYNQLKSITTTSTHTPAFGTETLFPGVYAVAAAGSVGGTLVLDAKGDVNAVFIFKIGGALTTGASSIISLINGASSCNVYWVAEGAISMAASTQMKGTLIANNAANSMGAGCTLEGRLFSTTGALSTNTSTAKLPVCGFVAPAWVGSISADWNNAGNWANGFIPSITTNITIPANTTFAPILSSGAGSVQNIIIQSGAVLTVTGGKLQIAGSITNSGIFDASVGTIEFNGTTAQTIPINTFKNNNLQNLIISNNITLAGAQNLSGKLSFGSSNVTLTTGNNLTLKSTVSGTAMVADITNGGALSGNTISGLVTVERYIIARRSWRLLATPIASINAPTINEAWQEGVGGASTSNPNSGYGTQITGGTIANGFDQGINGNSSIKVYNNTTNSLVALPANLGTNIPITNYPAYFIFIRGDRSTILLQGSAAALSFTTLRMKGQLTTGNTAINLNSGNISLVGNPYCSAVDFHTLTKTNVNDMFYAWNPQLNGTGGVGGYVTVSWNGASYDIVPSSLPATVTQYIQSGEAVFVQSPDAALPAQLMFKESDKNSGGSNFVFKPMTGKNGTLSVNLLGTNKDGTSYISDGILTSYNASNSNAVDNNDAKKMYNNAENICIAREGKDFAIERRKIIVADDTTFLNVYNLKKQNYKLQITGLGMDSDGLYAILKDKYSGIQKDTLLNMDGITEIVFNVNTDSASFAKDRFSIVFKKKEIVLIPTVAFLKVTRFLKDVQLEWKTDNQVQAKAFEVEVSANNIDFTKAAVINKVGDKPDQHYTWLDKFVVCGPHYYRIKTINNNGNEIVSGTVNIDIYNGCDKKYIEIEGNCIKGNFITLELNNITFGKYALSISSMDGIICKQIAIEQTSNNSVKDILMENYLPAGKYQVSLSGNGLIYTTYFMK